MNCLYCKEKIKSLEEHRSECRGYEKNFDYKGHMDRLTDATRTFMTMLMTVELDQIQSVLGQVDVMGMIMDPTRYRDALFSGTLDHQRALVSAASEFKKKMLKLHKILHDQERTGLPV